VVRRVVERDEQLVVHVSVRGQSAPSIARTSSGPIGEATARFLNERNPPQGPTSASGRRAPPVVQGDAPRCGISARNASLTRGQPGYWPGCGYRERSTGTLQLLKLQPETTRTYLYKRALV
jgi:hypothetical protein